MAASTSLSKSAAISKSDYLKRYLSNDVKKSKEKKIRKKRLKPSGKGMKIVDDDIDWKQLTAQSEKENKEEDEDDAPVIAEIIDERPDEVKLLEAFRSSNKWKVLGATPDSSLESQDLDLVTSSGINRINAARHDSPDSSPVRKVSHPSPDHSPKRRVRCDSPDLSPHRNDSPDLSPPRQRAGTKHRRLDSPSPSPPRKKSLPPKTQKQLHKDSPHREKSKSSSRRRVSDSDLSPPRRRPNARRDSDSDLSPPRKQSKGGKGSDSDLSPPRKTTQGRHGSDSDLSPPRQRRSPAAATGPRMLSGGTAGLVSVDMLRKEKENVGGENQNRLLEEESRGAATVFRGKGKLKREEEIRKAKEKAVQDEKYAQWGKGLAQAEMQQQNIEDAIREAQKPLARHIDDQDLDKMLREQERDGDPMAGLLRKKKEKSAKGKGVKERPRYQGPAPPPNRFSIMPGYRWDGVDRSNGFEQKHFSRMADKKAVQEEAYKWSVEDM